MNKVLIDTNVILYTYDYRDKKRKSKAEQVLRCLEKSNVGILSIQTLSEFMNVVTNGTPSIIESSEWLIQLNYWMRLFPIIHLNQNIVLEAVRGVKEHKLSFFDSQIWAAAKLNQIPLVFSEDFQDGQNLEGVLFVNPFSEKFDIGQWI